jgi:hypothetical protein
MKPVKVLRDDKTIAVCTGFTEPPYFVGAYSPVLLKEWCEHIIEMFGEDPVYVYQHKSSTASALAATQEAGDEFHISVAGYTTVVDTMELALPKKLVTGGGKK